MTEQSESNQRRGEACDAHLGVVCVAGGSGRRFGGDKLGEDLGGRQVLVRSIEALHKALPGALMVLVVPSDRVAAWRASLADHPPSVSVVAGGRRRQDSVRTGVNAAARAGAELVVVHDAARPLVHPADVRSVVAGLGEADGAVLCSAVADTVKRVDDSGAVLETVDRSSLRLAQTPQVFRISALEAAWLASDSDVTDEAALLELVGGSVRTVVARHPNPKLTTPADLDLIRSLWELKQ